MAKYYVEIRTSHWNDWQDITVEAKQCYVMRNGALVLEDINKLILAVSPSNWRNARIDTIHYTKKG